jgi:GNAT superfamily N-acetyltransferase
MPIDTAASGLLIRKVQADDFEEWLSLWNGYNSFYGRAGASALAQEVTQKTWGRFFNPIEPVFALVAEDAGAVVGLVHYIFHRSTTRLGPVCYLQDLFTSPTRRKLGIGKALISEVYQQAALAAASRVYWQTQASNDAGRALYDKLAKHSGFIVYSHEL